LLLSYRKRMQLSSLLGRFNEPETLKMAKLGRQLRTEGFDIIDLSLGEPDFDTPVHIKEAAKKAIDENWSHYPPVAGYADLRKAICEKLKRDNQLAYSAENIVVSTGAKQSIANAVLAIIEKGDEVIIPAPFWVTYSEIVKLAGGAPVFIKTFAKNNYKIPAAELEKNISAKTKLFIFSSPCNPTGAVYSREELKSLAEVFAKHPGIFIISDEIYEYINFTGPASGYAGRHQSIAQFDEIKDRVIVINGFSKGFAMTGYRLGYLAAHTEIAKACEKLQGQFTSGANAITQRAAIAALTGSLQPTWNMVGEFETRKKRIMELLSAIPSIECAEPQGAFYVFPVMKNYFGKKTGDLEIYNADDLCLYLLNQAHVSTVTGSAFGEPVCIRISFANSLDNIEKGMIRIINALEKLQ
jgi:aspartate aminotransferase